MSNWEKTMKEWDDSIPDGIKYLSAENRVLTRKVRELESENDALQARIAELESKQPWIPISSGRLPNKFQECIVLDSGGHVHNWIHDDALLSLFARYTHWMPLPSTPEVQE